MTALELRQGQAEKPCSKCGRLLPVERFNWTTGPAGQRYRRADCSQCHSLATGIRQRKNLKAHRERNRRYRQRNPERVHTLERLSKLRCKLRALGVGRRP